MCTLRSRAQYFPLLPTLWGPSHGGRVPCSMVVLGWVLLVKFQGNTTRFLYELIGQSPRRKKRPKHKTVRRRERDIIPSDGQTIRLNPCGLQIKTVN